MDHLGYIAVALCLLSVLATALLVPWLSKPSACAFSHAYEKKLKNFKLFRTILLSSIALIQDTLSIVKVVEQHGTLGPIEFSNILVGFTWTLAVVALLARWSSQATRKLPGVLSAFLLQAGCLLAMDVTQRTSSSGDMPDLDAEHIARIALHSIQMVLLLALLVLEVILQQQALLRSEESNTYEPLLSSMGRDEEQAAQQAGRRPKESLSRMAIGLQSFRYMWPKTSTLRVRVMMCLALVAAERAVNLGVPIMYKHVVDTLSKASALLQLAKEHGSPYTLLLALADQVKQLPFWSVFYPWVFGYIGLWLLKGASNEGLIANLRDLLWIPITQQAFRRISLDVFGHLLHLDLNFHLHRKTGQILRILDRGVTSIQDLVVILLFDVAPQIADIAISCTYLAIHMQPWAAIIVLATVCSYVPLTICITERRGVIRKRMNALDNERESRATDMLLNYETIKYFTNEQLELDGYDYSTRQYQAAEYWQMAFLSILSMVQSTVVWVGLASGMVVCVWGVAHGELTVGDAVLFITIMNQLYVPLTYFGSYYRQVQKALIDMENMFELLHTAPLVADAPGAKRLVVVEGAVRFDDITFGYSPLRPVLRNVNFEVPGGKTLAVVGATGSGKSTILRLLLRFYDPQGGAVLVDGQDVKTVTQASLRGAIAVVPQDTVLFNDTILYNIRYGRVGATDEEVYQAAQVAHIHQGIMSSFPAGYNTRVGERGLRLSGGEKQRVAFARAVLKEPAILVLDEATSALDSLTERQIQASLAEMRSRCTTVIVAHRLSTIMDADQIVVLDKGKVVECGTHAQLLATGKQYPAMWRRQQESSWATAPKGAADGAAEHVQHDLSSKSQQVQQSLESLPGEGMEAAAAAQPSSQNGTDSNGDGPGIGTTASSSLGSNGGAPPSATTWAPPQPHHPHLHPHHHQHPHHPGLPGHPHHQRTNSSSSQGIGQDDGEQHEVCSLPEVDETPRPPGLYRPDLAFSRADSRISSYAPTEWDDKEEREELMGEMEGEGGEVRAPAQMGRNSSRARLGTGSVAGAAQAR